MPKAALLRKEAVEREAFVESRTSELALTWAETRFEGGAVLEPRLKPMPKAALFRKEAVERDALVESRTYELAQTWAKTRFEGAAVLQPREKKAYNDVVIAIFYAYDRLPLKE